MKTVVWLAILVLAAAQGCPAQEKGEAQTRDALKNPSALTEKAPDVFKVRFDTTQGQKLMDIVDALINNGAVPGDPGSGSGGGTTDTGNSDPSSIAKAAANLRRRICFIRLRAADLQ